MTDDELFDAIAFHRARLVEQLEPLTDGQWTAPSLCEGWEVRHVVGHLVSLRAVPTWRFIVGSVGMSGFHRKVDRFAREFGERDKSDLLSRYRDLVGSRKAPPRIGPMAPLMDVIVHSLDIGKPLGLPSVLEARATREVLTAMSEGFPVMAPKSRSKGLRLEANDLDWASGQGHSFGALLATWLSRSAADSACSTILKATASRCSDHALGSRPTRYPAICASSKHRTRQRTRR